MFNKFEPAKGLSINDLLSRVFKTDILTVVSNLKNVCTKNGVYPQKVILPMPELHILGLKIEFKDVKEPYIVGNRRGESYVYRKKGDEVRNSYYR